MELTFLGKMELNCFFMYILFLCRTVVSGDGSFSLPAILSSTEMKNVSFSFDKSHYPKYNEMTRILQFYNSKYPEITKLGSVGKSVQGRELWYMQITDKPNIIEDGEPMFKYVGNMHGDEVISRQILLYLIEFLCDSYYTHPRIKKLVDSTNIFILPSMNPDGFEMAKEGQCDARVKSGRNNANDKDLNRNFPDQFLNWNKYELRKDAEPESRAIMRWIYKTPFVLSANLHGGSVVASYPFDSNKEMKERKYSKSPDDALFRHLALTYAKNHPVMKTGKPNCPADPDEMFPNGITNGAGWYNVPGGMQDFNYLISNCFEITVELSCCKYPFAAELSREWVNNKESLINYIEQVHRGIKGRVSDDAGAGIQKASIKIESIDHDVKSINNGDFWRLLLPGKYNVIVSADGYETVSKQGITVNDKYPTVLNFILKKGNIDLTTLRPIRDESTTPLLTTTLLSKTTQSATPNLPRTTLPITSNLPLTSGQWTSPRSSIDISTNQVQKSIGNNFLNKVKQLIPLNINKMKQEIPLTTEKIKQLFEILPEPKQIKHHNYETLTGILVSLKKQYPNIANLYSIGKSVERRELWVFELSNNPGVHQPGKPEFRFVANVHGNEVVGRECLLLLIQFLCQNYKTSPQVRSIIDNSRIHILPSLNPDGYEQARVGDRQGLDGRNNANNIDLNRNYPDQYDNINSVRNFQPETLAMMAWIKKNTIMISVNLHGGALVANYPYDDTLSGEDKYSKSPDDSLFRYLATIYSDAHPMMHYGNGCPEYPSETFEHGITNGAQWYSVKGGMQDYNYLHSNNFEITVEMGCFKFPPEDRMLSYWNGHKVPLLRMIVEIFKGLKGFIKTTAGAPIFNATIAVKGIPHNIHSLKDGDYFRLLLPGSYEIAVFAVGFKDKVEQIHIIGGLAQELNFTLRKLNEIINIKPNAPVTTNFEVKQLNTIKSGHPPEQVQKDMYSKLMANSTSSLNKVALTSSPVPPDTTKAPQKSGFQYHTYESMFKYLQDHQEKFSDIVKLHAVSSTPNGRHIWSVEISTNPGKADPDKANIGLIAGMYGYDSIGREILLMFLHSIVKQYNEKSKRIRTLLSSVRLHIIPMVMVDSMEDAKIGDCDGEKFPKSRVDIYNKFDWRDENADLQVVKDIKAWMKDGNFLFSALIEGGESMISYQPDSIFAGDNRLDGDNSYDEKFFKNLALHYTASNKKMNGGKDCHGNNRHKGIETGVKWKSRENTLGMYAYLALNSLQLNIHLSCCRTPNPENVSTIWNENKESLLLFTEQAYSRVYGHVTDMKKNELTDAWLTFSNTKAYANVSAKGSYQKYLEPGKYTISAENDSLESLKKEVIVSKTSAIKEDFVLHEQPEFNHHKHEDLTKELFALSHDYPAITKLYSIGKSVEDRKLWVLEITDNPGKHEAGEPEVKYIAGIHGNEVAGRELLLLLARHLCMGFGNDHTITSLINKTRIHILPLANPDGAEQAIQESCNSDKGSDNANGVDLAQDFPVDSEDKNKPTQPESKAILNWIKKTPFVLSATLHSGSVVVSYPYSHGPSEVPEENPTQDDDVFKSMAKSYSSDHPTMSKGRPFCPGPEVKESFTNGIVNMAQWTNHSLNMLDFNYLQGKSFEVAIYTGCCKAPPKSELNILWKDNKKSLLKFLNLVHAGVKGFVYDDVSKKPLSGVKIHVNGRDYVTESAEFGDYWRLLLPGSYKVTAAKNGYSSKDLMVHVNSNKHATMVNFSLERNRSMRVTSVIFVALACSCVLVFILLVFIVVRICRYKRRYGKRGFKPLRHQENEYLKDTKKGSGMVLDESELSDLEEDEEEVIFSDENDLVTKS